MTADDESVIILTSSSDGSELPAGEAVADAIVLNPGMELSDEDLIAYCRANLPSYKKPRYVAFVDALPHNVTGKMQKSVLRENADKLFRLIRGL